MPGVAFVSPKVQFFDSDGEPLASGTIDVYVPGTTTRRDSYSDYNISVPNANPVVLDSAGRATIYLDPSLSYKFVVKDSSGSTVYTEDNVPGSAYGHIVRAATVWPGSIKYESTALENSLGYAGAGGNFFAIGGSYAPASVPGGSQSMLTVGGTMTTLANKDCYMLAVGGIINRAGSGIHGTLAAMAVGAPTIGAGASTVTVAASLFVNGAPTGGVSNYALYVISGLVSLCGFTVTSAGVVAAPYTAQFSWNSKSKSTVYTADSDMLIVVSVTQNTTTSCVVNLKSDASNPPTTIRASIAVGTAAGYAVSNSMTVPVRRGDRYLVEETALSGSAPTYTINAVPLGASSTGGS